MPACKPRRDSSWIATPGLLCIQNPRQPDPDHLRTERAYYQLIHDLYARLPPPLDDTPEALAARNAAALAQVAAMAPVNADEAGIAAHCVATRAQAGDVQLLIRSHASDIALVTRLNAQYTSMERTALAIRNQLHRLQMARLKREADSRAADSDALTRHIATRLMEQATERGPARGEAHRVLLVSDEPPPLATPRATQDTVPPFVPAPAAAPPNWHAVTTAAEAEEAPHDLAAEADYYARVYPQRARLIRQLGGLPPDCSFGPPDDDLVRELLTSSNPILRALDDLPAAAD
jgi:hypothetical protein